MSTIYRFDEDFIKIANEGNLKSPFFKWVKDYENLILEILNYYLFKESFRKNTKKAIYKLLGTRGTGIDLIDIVKRRDFFGTAELPDVVLKEFKKLTFKNVVHREYYKFFFNKRSDIAFCEFLKKKYPDMDFSAAKDFFEANIEINKRLGKKEYIGIILTTAAVVTNQIPKAIIESIGIDYQVFHVVVFLIFFVVLSCLALSIFTEWYLFVKRRKRPQKFVLQILRWLLTFEIIPNKANAADR